MNPFTAQPEILKAIRAGQFVAWETRLSSALTGGTYNVQWVFRQEAGSTPAFSTIGTSTDQRVWSFNLTGAATMSVAAGNYVADMICTRISDGENVTLMSNRVKVIVSNEDRRSHARIMVQKIESVLSGRAEDDVVQYSIRNRSITKMSVSELTKWRDYYLAEANAEPEDGMVTGSKKNTVKVGFI